MNNTHQLLRAALTTRLASSSIGRIILHGFCMIRRPGRVRWHWNGIVRELAPLKAVGLALVTFPVPLRRSGVKA